MTAPTWTSPYTANPAAHGYGQRARTRPRRVAYDGRRFLVWPQLGGTGWCWRERGASECYLASSEVMAYLMIGGYAALTRGTV